MPIAQNDPPISQSLPGLSVLSWASATATPVGVSRDRATVYGSAKADSSSTILYESVNDGTTWTSIHTFVEGVYSLVETDDGEAVVTTGSGGSGFIYKSSGWAASHASATWTKVLTTPGGVFGSNWGMHFCTFGNDLITPGTSKIGVTCEYGPQSSGSGDQTVKGRRAYVTQDYGTTWTLVLDLAVRYPSVVNLHLHAAAYDPWADRLWVTFGDTTQDSNATMALLYSDDRGATWNAFPLPAEWAGLNYLQCTSIGVFEDCLVFGNDAQTHNVTFWRLSRTGYRTFSTVQAVVTGDSNSAIGQAFHRSRNVPGAPIFATFSITSTKPSCIFLSYDGLSFSEIWRDPTATKVPGVTAVYGPMISGKVLARVAMPSSAVNLLVGELVLPDGGQFEGYAAFTGDATTTVFNIAHGLGVKPSKFSAWSQNAVGGAFTVTADATNLIITFASAPASAARAAIAYRYAL